MLRWTWYFGDFLEVPPQHGRLQVLDHTPDGHCCFGRGSSGLSYGRPLLPSDLWLKESTTLQKPYECSRSMNTVQLLANDIQILRPEE